MTASVSITPASNADWPDIWAMIAPVFQAGETYAVAPDIAEDDARSMWTRPPTSAYIARDNEGAGLGTYYLKPNFAGPARRTANCGYIVDSAGRGRGLARAMCRHSQDEALKAGFDAMVFNCVASTNKAAIKAWKAEGFETVGTLPKIFDHPKEGLVDAHIMHKRLSALEAGHG